ncbi:MULTISPECIES: DUF5606 domain-containing protein [unclassified Aureispira]|uniref:DUF5606 family protein n=1 Tax=unclassified Aureispira TaxID=2649989 RepID=UPI0006974BC4|nr:MULTISPECIES: DUF5606 domain-containing protein [unclassified Aureispira]WMX12654.1 DUF5606 domain-containing protein [Aureispira sp. CCB-E]
MNLEKLVAVSGRSGIYKMAANRPNGLIIEDLDTGKKFFAPSRRHQFTPLESISIYTDTEEATVELKAVFISMLTQLESNPPVATKASSVEIKNYFEGILPEYDRDKVLVSDIKKLIKWFNFLNERGLLSLPTEEELAAEAAAKEEAAKKEEKVDQTEE